MGKITMNKITLTLFAMILAITQVRADSVTVPNTFVDGTTASASEVNANFDTLASGINSIRSINVYVNGVRRGPLIDTFSSVGGGFVGAEALRILLDSGYITLVSVIGDGVRDQSLRYESIDCTGQPYLLMELWNPMMAKQGVVISNDVPDLGTLYYVQAGTTIENITIESQMKDGVCELNNRPNVDAAKVYVNEPTLTGVMKNDFIGDVTIGF